MTVVPKYTRIYNYWPVYKSCKYIYYKICCEKKIWTKMVYNSIPPISTKQTIQHYVCDKVCHWLPTGQWFTPSTPISSTSKTDCHNITEILLKVELNTIKPKQNQRLYLTSNYYWTPKRPRHMALEILLYFHRLLIRKKFDSVLEKANGVSLLMSVVDGKKKILTMNFHNFLME